MNNESKYLTVSVINRYLKDQFDRNEHLRCVFLKGEISNFKGHTTGHLYFSLKDVIFTRFLSYFDNICSFVYLFI